MTDRIDPKSVGGIRPQADQGRAVPVRGKDDAASDVSFSDVLQEAETSSLRFSNHAIQRLEQRGIKMSDSDLELLSEGVRRAQEKGSRESLLLMDNTAYVVNVQNRTVITAVDQDGMKDKTFTNIDSAIMLSRK